MLNITDEKIINEIGFPFYYWAIYGRFKITEQDLPYLDKIKKHPCFPLILERHSIMFPILDWANARITEIVFYERFYKDENCPAGVKNILFSMIGLMRGNLEGNNMTNLLEFRYHSIELWLDSVTQRSSP